MFKSASFFILSPPSPLPSHPQGLKGLASHMGHCLKITPKIRKELRGRIISMKEEHKGRIELIDGKEN